MDGRLDAAVSITFLFYVVTISESRHFVCKCYVSRIVRMLEFLIKEPYTVRLWRRRSSVRLAKLHCTYTEQHKLCTDTNTVLDIVKATSLYRTVMHYFT